MARADAADIVALLSHAAQAPIQTNYAMAQECSFRLGGPAKYFCVPQNPEALRSCLLLCRQLNLPCLVIGGGTNLLFRDNGYEGVVISTKKLDYFAITANKHVRVGAGLSNTVLTDKTLQHALTGFEWASGLPGTVGGGVFMNAKCYGSSFSEIVIEVKALTPLGQWSTLSASECKFDYKQSIFQKNHYIITEVLLALSPGHLELIRTRTEEILADRKQKGQFLFPSAGCAYKNDYTVGIPSGLLIESCGLKGYQIGGIRVFEQHANFLVNTGNGRTQDVLDLMALIEKKVWKKHHIRLKPEICIVP